MVLFGDRGVPDGYRKMVSLHPLSFLVSLLSSSFSRTITDTMGHSTATVDTRTSSSTLRDSSSTPRYVSSSVNSHPRWHPVQFHYRCDQGTAFLTQDVADKLAGSNPDYAQQDLFEAIARGEFPSWTLCVQTMTVEQAEAFKYNILDLTKIWSHADYPLRPIGKLTLNANPQNYFRA
jgi:catalase